MITYGKLGEEIQETTGIRTTSLLQNWISRVLFAVAETQAEEEPALTAFVIDSDGYTGRGYDNVVERQEEELSREDHAARERLGCHRFFEAPDLPPDGGSPTYPPGVLRDRAEERRRAQNRPREACPKCFTQLPATGVCDECG
jgi:hypothetical protein